MINSHGQEMVKIISISIQLIVSLMRFLITEAEALIMPSCMLHFFHAMSVRRQLFRHELRLLYMTVTNMQILHL